jgi:hypothetical protein
MIARGRQKIYALSLHRKGVVRLEALQKVPASDHVSKDIFGSKEQQNPLTFR